MQQIIANKYVVAIRAVRRAGWCSPCRTVARLIDLASDLLDCSLKLVLVCTGCPVSTLYWLWNTSRTVSLVHVLPINRLGGKKNPHATFRPWGKPLLSSAHLLTLLKDPFSVTSCCYWCVHAMFNRAFDAKGKPCLGGSVLEHLFLPNCSSLIPNLHLHCISIVQRHTVEFLCH